MDWINCNTCCRQPGDEKERMFMLSSCGHIFCDLCLAQADSRNKCRVCSAQCQIIQLSSKMNPDAELYFQEPAELVKKHNAQLNRLLEFQKEHRFRLVSFHRKVFMKYKELEQKFKLATERIHQLEKENSKLKEVISCVGGGKDFGIGGCDPLRTSYQRAITASALRCSPQAAHPGSAHRISPGSDPRISSGNAPRISPGNTPRISPGNAPRISPGSAPRISPGRLTLPKCNTPLTSYSRESPIHSPGDQRQTTGHNTPAKGGHHYHHHQYLQSNPEHIARGTMYQMEMSRNNPVRKNSIGENYSYNRRGVGFPLQQGSAQSQTNRVGPYIQGHYSSPKRRGTPTAVYSGHQEISSKASSPRALNGFP